MKQKWLVVLALVGMMLLASPLTVSAESSDVPKDELSDDWYDVDDAWGNMSKYGYANDMMIVMSLFDGLEEEIATVEDMGKMHVLSAPLEPGHFYLATMDFMIVVDRENIDKYDDINLQVRFPATLLKNSPNAIGFSVNGSKIDTWCDTFGISCEEDLDLYYLDQSGKLTSLAREDDFRFRTEAMNCLFGSETGLPMGEHFREAFRETMNMGQYEVTAMQVQFVLYAAPQEGRIYCDDTALNYWAGQELMYAIKTTPAPKADYYTATMDADGNVQIPHEDEEEVSEPEDNVPWIIICCLILFVVGLVIFLGHKVRKSAHERGITGFMNIFMDFMKLSDEYDND